MDHTEAAAGLVQQINNIIIFPLISLLIAAAMVYFMWGAFTYLQNADNPSARAEGQKHMIFGIIGFVVMVTAYTLLSVVTGTLFGSGAVPPR